MDYDALRSLNASAGDIIEIIGSGKKRTLAKCLHLYPSDEGKGVIRVDGLLRSNAGVAIGDTITTTKVKTVPAKKITLASFESRPPIDERYLADALEDVPIVKGDKVMILYFGGRLAFQVIATAPAANHLLVTKKTAFTVSERGDALAGISHVTYEDIGGLREEIQKVREMIDLPLRHPEIFEKLGIEAPKGVHCIA